jgi:DNA modification methylase
MLEGMGVKDEIQDAEPQFDRAAELLEKWGVKTGDLWRIGEHRLLCGDSTKREDVERVMGGEKAELLFTSPPYSDMREYEGGDLSIENITKFIPAFVDYCNYQVINLGIQRKEGEIYPYWDSYINQARECGYKLLAWNIWNRESAKTIAQQSAMFPVSHEWIFVFGNKAKELNKTKGKAEATLKDKRIDNTNKFTSITSVLTLQPALDENITNHPARFPVEFPLEYIDAMTKDGEFVAEPFAGSGTTLVACENLKRKGRGIEISPAYCAVTLERMSQAFPGIEIHRENTENG